MTPGDPGVATANHLDAGPPPGTPIASRTVVVLRLNYSLRWRSPGGESNSAAALPTFARVVAITFTTGCAGSDEAWPVLPRSLKQGCPAASVYTALTRPGGTCHWFTPPVRRWRTVSTSLDPAADQACRVART